MTTSGKAEGQQRADSGRCAPQTRLSVVYCPCSDGTPTCIVTVAIAAIVSIRYLVTWSHNLGLDWRADFFVLNCVATPFWIIFYRMMGGNISELRMLVPILLPIFYGLAIQPANPAFPTPECDGVQSQSLP